MVERPSLFTFCLFLVKDFNFKSFFILIPLIRSQGYHSYSESRDGELGDVSDRHSAELNGGGGGSGHPSLSATAMVARVATPRPGTLATAMTFPITYINPLSVVVCY